MVRKGKREEKAKQRRYKYENAPGPVWLFYRLLLRCEEVNMM